MSNLPILKEYQFIVNEEGNLLLLIDEQKEEVDLPRLYYDGGDHALLMRTLENIRILPNIPVRMRVPLGFASHITVHEMKENGESSRVYEARVHFAQDIPALQGIAEAIKQDAA